MQSLIDAMDESWNVIAPSWPLENIIAVNPLKGFEEMQFEKALAEGAAYFEQEEIPQQFEVVNIECLKWCQAFFDAGQATFKMPYKKLGFFKAFLKLAKFDRRLKKGNEFLQELSVNPEQAIVETLGKLNIPKRDAVEFFKILLTTLPGWSSFVKNTEFKTDYLAVRIVITYILWKGAAKLLSWKKGPLKHKEFMEKLCASEQVFSESLFSKIELKRGIEKPEAQLVFCIDVRSEPFRRALESEGKFETYGFAGFFGIPMEVQSETSEHPYASCPVLLKPKHTVIEKGKNFPPKIWQSLYQSAKYTFIAPFALVELMAPLMGVLMLLKSFTPKKLGTIKSYLKSKESSIDFKSIRFEEQCAYAESALRSMGLISNFSKAVVFCGHGSTTQNNAYASSLDCGACAGRSGLNNARVLAQILNQGRVREELRTRGIAISPEVHFYAALHDTTTNKLIIEDSSKETHYLEEACKRVHQKLNLKSDTLLKSNNWAEMRPEWGLAKNAAFVVGPRSLTAGANLEGRVFLHSYNWEQDADGKLLTGILTAPMIVAQWINCQYFFSTYDNVSYGAGSKITKNISGKIGTMQGNCSDLMPGLPLQSVNSSDHESYHELARLHTVVYAPLELVEAVVEENPLVKKLIDNQWVHLTCIEPKSLKRNYF